MNQIISITAFGFLAALWLAFGAALFLNRELLGSAWRAFRSLPLLVQLVLALLILPVVLGLWIWNSRLPAWLRLGLVAGLAWFTISTFFPRLPLA